MSIISYSVSKSLSFLIVFFLFNMGNFPAFAGREDKEEETSREVKKIVILGAGMAGLSAAKALGDEKVTIYEGRDRIGGRAHTRYLNDKKTAFFEEGGTFIDSDHTDTINLAKELGVELTKRGYGSKSIPVIFQGTISKPDVLVPELQSATAELKKQWKEIPGNGMEIDEKTYEWHSKPLTPHLSALSPVGESFVETLYETETGIDTANGAAIFLPWLYEKTGDYANLLWLKNSSFVPNFVTNRFAYDYTVKGGMSKLVNALQEKLAPKVDIKLSHKLTAIRKEENYVLTFNTENGEKEVRADQVIMTLPFSTLRHVKLDPSLGLSELQTKAIQNLPYGTHAKIGVPVSASKNMTNDLLYYVNLDDRLIGWPGENAFTFHVGGQRGKGLTVEDAKKLFQGQQQYISQQFPYITGYNDPLVKNWTQDEFSLGSYSGITTKEDLLITSPHQDKRFSEMRAFAEPVNNTFFWAGEHTRADGSDGHIEGAVRSGYKAAQFLKFFLRK